MVWDRGLRLSGHGLAVLWWWSTCRLVVVWCVFPTLRLEPWLTPCTYAVIERQRAEAAEVLLRQQEVRNQRYMVRIKDFQVRLSRAVTSCHVAC
jgi:hypothetical protein